jgi:hypothetical protein
MGALKANRTHAEEFYEVTDAEPEFEAVAAPLADWEICYKTVRPTRPLATSRHANGSSLTVSYQPRCNGRIECVHGLDGQRATIYSRWTTETVQSICVEPSGESLMDANSRAISLAAHFPRRREARPGAGRFANT